MGYQTGPCGTLRSPSLRRTLAVLTLALALSACNLAIGTTGEPAPRPTADPGAGTPEQVAAGGVPTVRIVSPVDGQQVPAHQRVDITVATDSTATSFLLNVNGRVASSKSLPAEQSGPTEAILSWTPGQEGSYTLEVIAAYGNLTSAPASVTLNVSGTAPAPNGAGAGGASGECTGRVLVGKLNFRDGPGTRAAKLGQFDMGETVRIIGRNADTTWYRVERAANAQQVWTINNSQWIQTQGVCGTSLPVVE